MELVNWTVDWDSKISTKARADSSLWLSDEEEDVVAAAFAATTFGWVKRGEKE